MTPPDGPVATDPEVGRTVDVAGVATNYHDVGTDEPGRPPVLLLHGSGPGVSAWANWRGVLPELAQWHRVLAPDALGFGYTAAPAGPRTWSLTAWYEHLAGFLDALGLSRVSVVGNSFGGALALRLATEQPGRVDRLVLMGSVGVPFPLTPGLDEVWGFRPTLPGMRTVLDLFAHDRDRITDDLAQLRLRAATRPGIAEAYAEMFPAPRQAGVDSLVVDEAAVAALTQPALLLHGRDDRVIPLATSLRLLELIPAAQLHVFGQCGHWVQIEQRERFLRLVEAFLSE